MKRLLRVVVPVLRTIAASEPRAILIAAFLATIFYYLPSTYYYFQSVRIEKDKAIQQSQPRNVQPSPAATGRKQEYPVFPPQFRPASPSLHVKSELHLSRALDQADEDFQNNPAQAYRAYERIYESLPANLKQRFNGQVSGARKDYKRAKFDEAARSMHDVLQVALGDN